MQSVRLHLDGGGVLWLLAKCSRCGQVHKHLAANAAAGEIRCKSCNWVMRVEGAVLGKPSIERDSRST